MGLRAAHTSPLLSVDRGLSIPLHKQVYDGYRNAILRGDLRPGQEVPSSRMCAIELGISRFPALHAYAQLIAEGYFETRVGSGTFVARHFPEQLIALSRPSETAPSGVRRVAKRGSLYPPYANETHNGGWGHSASTSRPSMSFHSKFGQAWSRVIAGTLERAFSTMSTPSAQKGSASKSASICEPRVQSNVIQARSWWFPGRSRR